MVHLFSMLLNKCKKIKKQIYFQFSKVIARCLKNYIIDGTEVDRTCPECGAEGSLVYQEGCVTCKILAMENVDKHVPVCECDPCDCNWGN